MKLNVDTLVARTVIEDQLAEYINRLNGVRELLKQGEYQKAYNLFPYHDPVGENLETFVDQRDTDLDPKT